MRQVSLVFNWRMGVSDERDPNIDTFDFDTREVFESSDFIGTQIGPYKLLQVIGEGGFGVVYLAEQKQPIRRRVALKVIKLGMDTRQVIARFEAERQALAGIPNILVKGALAYEFYFSHCVTSDHVDRRTFCECR